MEYKVFNSYGGFSLENEGVKLAYADIKDKKVETLNGEIGYIRIVGVNNVHEHGYSAQENIYKLITLNYEVISLPDTLKIV